MSWSGGCQCGAVRFRVEGELGRASLCHCRMCQKALGGPFGPFVSVPIDQITWTRGERARFASSNKVFRGFCAACGTPLTFEWSADVIDLTFYSFDRADEITPVVQLEAEAAAPWVRHIADLPKRDPKTEPHLVGYYASVVSNQHPDHDT
jgi:hypothetical protein